MPVLARVFEKVGLSTILVTPMPYWAERVGVPRSLAVEAPFAQILGPPHNSHQQMHVICQALEVLEGAKEPGMILHSPVIWPQPQPEALKEWQPQEPSPIVKALAPRIRSILREGRRA